MCTLNPLQYTVWLFVLGFVYGSAVAALFPAPAGQIPLLYALKVAGINSMLLGKVMTFNHVELVRVMYSSINDPHGILLAVCCENCRSHYGEIFCMLKVVMQKLSPGGVCKLAKFL